MTTESTTERALRPTAKRLPEHARSHNLSLVLQTLYRDGSRSRADIARETRSAVDSATVFETLVAQTDTRRASVSGVSVDEELISLMQHQQAYVAATRVVTAVDEMLRDLLGMVR